MTTTPAVADNTTRYTCGHETVTAPLFGASRPGRLASSLCQACQDAARAEVAEAFVARAARRFATLTGSEKQVAWATKIRTHVAAHIAGQVARELAAPDADRATAETWFDGLAWDADVAGWWIDRRFEGDRTPAAFGVEGLRLAYRLLEA